MGEYDGAVRRIVDGATAVLERKGLLVGDPEARRLLAGVAGISVEGERARISARVAEEFLRRYRAEHEYRAPEEFTVSTMAHASHIVDLDGTLRPITREDNDRMARLSDALLDKGILGGAPGIPQDVAPPLRSISQFMSSARNSRQHPAWAGQKSLGNELLMKRCLEAMGLSYGIGVHVVSPLRLVGQEVDVALAVLARFPDLPVSIGSMPVVGLTTPMTAVSGFVVSLAEVLGAGIVFRELGARRVGLSLNLYPFDMRYSSFTYGAPANVAVNRLEIELNRQVLKTHIVSKSFKTMSQRPGAQACLQKAAFTGIMAESGKRAFSGAGCLSLDEIFSPVQLVYDCELLSYVRKVYDIRGGLAADERLLLEVIMANSTDQYVEEPTTLEYCRELQWDSRVFPSYLLGQWNAAGRPEPEAAAAAAARALLAKNDFALAEETSRELDGLYEWATRHMDEL